MNHTKLETADTAITPAKRKTSPPSVNWAMVQFNLPLDNGFIPLFREAVLRCIDNEGELEIWSNESRNKDGKTVHLSNYPLIQFRVYRKHAAIYAMQAGVPLLEKFVNRFANPHTKQREVFTWRNHPYSLEPMFIPKENNFPVRIFSPKLRTETVVYRLQTWLPMNKENYAWWKENRNAPDIHKTAKLQEILISHICAFISASGGFIPKQRIKLIILDKDRLKKVFFKDIGVVAFDLRYTVNLELPSFIGLGNHPAFGYGWQRLEDKGEQP